jgi:allantoinase
MGATFELLIQGGRVVFGDRVEQADIGIRDGVIAAIGKLPAEEAESVLRADGHVVVPGMIDVHVHFNEPGLEDWEGIPTGSAALAAGGCTAYFDMPLNGLPPTTTLAAVEQKKRLLAGRSNADYALWGGLVPGNLEELAPMAEAGVIGFKAFMSAAGGKQEGAFREVDDTELYRGMQEIARLGKILALHAESEAVIRALAADKARRGLSGSADYVRTRPVYAELEAVRRALFFAEQTGCALHFVHISSPEAVREIGAAKRAGLDVTLETCPHYLTLTEEALEEIGPVAKCAPPLRTRKELEGLWQAIAQGEIDMISSDHSPCPPDWKASDDWFEIWGGIAAAQNSLELVLGGLSCRCSAGCCPPTPRAGSGSLPAKGKSPSARTPTWRSSNSPRTFCAGSICTTGTSKTFISEKRCTAVYGKPFCAEPSCTTCGRALSGRRKAGCLRPCRRAVKAGGRCNAKGNAKGGDWNVRKTIAGSAHFRFGPLPFCGGHRGCGRMAGRVRRGRIGRGYAASVRQGMVRRPEGVGRQDGRRRPKSVL